MFLQAILTILFYLFLLGILILQGLNLRSSTKSADAATKSAAASERSAAAAEKSAEATKKLAEKRQT